MFAGCHARFASNAYVCRQWFVSLQVEGASAVHAAFDVLLQLRAEEQPTAKQRDAMLRNGLAAVADTCYHGPGSTSFGSTQPLGMHARQVSVCLLR